MNRIAIVIFLAALVGCQKSVTQYVPTQEPSEPAVTVIDEATKTKAIAAKEELFKQLSGRLMEVMKSEGPAAAIEVCSKEAFQFAENVGDQHDVKIGRTSLKLRNSKNFPPSWAKSLTSENATEPQFVSVNDDTVGALLPIKLQQKCLTCHGPKDSLSSEVKDQLSKHYPDDHATGYQEGDLRGWFWVEIPKTATDAPLIIDVRSKEEWDTGHLQQAINIPHTEIGDRIGEVTSQKDAKVIVYCRSGGRAGMAKTALEELGFPNVENAGGFDEIKVRFPASK